MTNEEMRTMIMPLPDGDGGPQRICHIDIPLSCGRLGCVEFPWPLTNLQKEALAFQLAHAQEVVRRFFVVSEAKDGSPNQTEQEAGIVSVQTPGAGDRVAASGDADSTQAPTGSESPSVEDVHDGGGSDAQRNEASEAVTANTDK